MLLGVCTVAASMAPSFAWAFASFFLAGLGYSFLNPASTKGVMAWFDRDERATAMGIKQTGVPAGGVLDGVVGARRWFCSSVGVAPWSPSGSSTSFSDSFFHALWRDPEDRDITSATRHPPAPEDHRALDIWSFLPASCGTAIFLVGQMALITYLPLYLKESMGFSAYWASQALAITQAGAMFGRVGWGAASDRLFGGRRKIVLLIIGIMGSVLLVALSFMSRQSPLSLLLLVVFLSGLCLVGYQGVSYALIGELAGRARTGAALGLMITINAGAATLGTPLFGFIVDRSESYAMAWQALAGAVAVGCVGLAALLKEPRRTVELSRE